MAMTSQHLSSGMLDGPPALLKNQRDDGDEASTTCGTPGSATTPAPTLEGTPPRHGPIGSSTGRSSSKPQVALEAEVAMGFFAILQASEHCPRAVSAAELATEPEHKQGAAILLRRCLKLLILAGHTRESLQETAVHGAAYMSALTKIMRSEGSPELPLKECAYIICVHMFLAHSYLEDVNLPLRTWHKHIFVNYCPMKLLNTAVLGMMQKLEYKLSIAPEVVEEQLAVFRR